MKIEGYCQNFEAFVVPDYDTVVECLHCKEDGFLGCNCSSCYRNVYVKLHQMFLGAKIFLECQVSRSAPLYEKTWVGEMMNWGSKLPIYNQTKLGLKCHG